MYTPMPRKIAENAKKMGTLVLSPTAKWMGSMQECFVPFEAKYIQFRHDKDVKVARFYLTMEKDKIKYERLALHYDASSDEKAVEMMFFDMLFHSLLSHAMSKRARIIQIETKHPDAPELFLEYGFDFRKMGEYYKGKRNVLDSPKKAEKTH